MKKNLTILAMFVAVFAFGIAQANAAVPFISGIVGDGALAGGEWANDSDPGAGVVPYTYYLSVTDPNEAGIPDQYDISGVTLLQELGVSPAPDGSDGIYLLVTTHGAASLDPFLGGVNPAIFLQADFNGDGASDLTFKHEKDGLGVQRLGWIRPAGTVLPGGPTADYVFFGVEGTHFKLTGSVIEYFFPTGTGGTPPLPFPVSFIGTIRYDNGGTPDDDVVTGSLTTNVIPEPGTMFLLGSGLLSMLGAGRFGKK